MSRYDRHHDYGLRGYHDVTRSPRHEQMSSARYGEDFGWERRADIGRVPRVRSSYNEDYMMGGRPTEPTWGDRGSNFIGGEPGEYRRPYITRSGSRTFRGSNPPGYDYPAYGPNYGGRYPDEL